MLTAGSIEGFTTSFLLSKYENPQPVPDFHREMWEMCCSDEEHVAIAAPRGHAKSTAITHAYVLASVLFRQSRYVLLVSCTEGQSSNFLGDIKTELDENEDLREMFGIRRLSKDSVTDIICEMDDGWKFRITAQGAEQKVRGKKWGGTRPDLIICDDIEEDEAVENEQRRAKFKSWFFKALEPSLSSSGKIRVVGTILHMDSLLQGLMKNEAWNTVLYKAHAGFDDFSDMLWPEQWTEDRLRKKRLGYIGAGEPEGYSQEFLNDPTDQSEAYFRRDDFLPMEDNDWGKDKNYYAGVDFAISDVDKRAYTVIVVGGMDSDGILNIEYVLRFRGDADEIIRNIIAVQRRFGIDFFKVEKGQILQTLEPVLIREALNQGVPLLLNHGTPTKDKRSRARAIQARFRAGGVKLDKKAEWYPAFEEELLHFPKGEFKDQVDAIAWLGIAINDIALGATETELADEDYEQDYLESFMFSGRSQTTGY